MSIYNKGCLILKPSGYAAGKIYSVFPNTAVGDFNVSRSSTTTRINASGYIEDVAANVPRLNYDSDDSCPYLLTENAGTNLITYPISFGNSYWTKSGASIEGDSSTAASELVTNGGFDTDSDWTKQTGWSISGGSANANVGNDVRLYQSGIGLQVGKTYLLKFDVSNYVSGGVNGFLGYTKADGKVYATSNGSFEVTISPSNVSQDYVRFHSVTSFVGSIDNVSVKEVQGFEAPKEKPVANGEELVTNGSFTGSATGWQLNGTAAYNSNSVNLTGDGTVNNWLFQTTLNGINNHYYILEYEVTNNGLVGGSLLLPSGTHLIFDATTLPTENGVHQVLLKSKASGDCTQLQISLNTSATGGSLSIDNISVKEVTSWSGGGFEREAFKLVEDTSNGKHQSYSSFASGSSGNNYTTSFFVKAGERTWCRIMNYGGKSVYFDLENGVVGTEANASGKIEAMANGWYRISMTYTSESSERAYIHIADADNSVSYQGDGTSGIYIAYAQIEEQASATSLMLPTTEGSTTSRVGDSVTDAGTSATFENVNASGTLYAEIAALADDGTFRYISLFGDTSNHVQIYYKDSSNKVTGLVRSSGTVSFIFTHTLTDATKFIKVAVKYKQNDFALWVNGVKVGSGTSGSTFSASTLSECALNNAGGGGNSFYGKTKGVAVFDYLSDNEMIELTT